MRDIKFRAWNPKRKEMFFPATLSENSQTDHSMGFGGFEMMQFTGLLDKNGKEIYEGDIVSVSRQCAFQYDYYIQKGIIKFGYHTIRYDSDMAGTGPAYGFYLESISEPISRYDAQKGDSMIGEYVSLEDTKSMEVIGNIYENS